MTMRPPHHIQPQGAVLVEFAYVFPLFMLLLFAAIEIGWILYCKHAMTLTASFAARELSLPQANKKVIESLTKQQLADLGLNMANVKVSLDDSRGHCYQTMPLITASITAPLSSLSLLGNPLQWFTEEGLLRSRITMRKECPTEHI